jgi:hypothetical protein
MDDHQSFMTTTARASAIADRSEREPVAGRHGRDSSVALAIRQPTRVLQPFAEAEGGLVALLRATLRTPHPQARELPLAVRPVDGSHGDWFCEPF